MRPDIHARLAAWRGQGVDRVDPLRFAWMEALARRAAHHDGAVRQRLDARLHELADAYAALLADHVEAMPPRRADESPLRQLLAQFDDAPRLGTATRAASVAQTGEPSPAIDAAPMPVLDEFRQLWSRIRIDGLLRQSLESLSEDAGPLHSSVLICRAMMLMREVSPEYLQHFIAYTDVLTWMESPGGDADAASAVRKPARAGGGRRKKPAVNPET